MLIAAAANAGHESIVAEAQKLFKAYFGGDKKAIHPSLRLAVFSAAIKYGGRAEFEAVQKEFINSSSVDGKEITLVAMGSVQTPELASEYLKWSFSGAVALQDTHTPATSLAARSKARLSVWEFVKSDWQTIYEKLGGNMVLVERYVRMSLSRFSSNEIEQDIQKFFADKDQRGYDRGLAVASDSIKGQASYKERDAGVIREWLSAHGY